MAAPKILAFAGSTRTGSFNKKLVKVAAEMARAAGAEVTYLDLRDLALPLYDGDLEETQGLPAGGRRFKDLLLAHDALLISSPEYNSGYSGVLKNAIDWASRPAPGEKPLECFQGKVAALLAASPGALGGLRGLVMVRMLLGNIGVHVVPQQLAVSHADQAFTPEGELKDAKQKQTLEKIVEHLVSVASKLKA